MTQRLRDRSAGFTLVEVLIAVTLGLFVMAGMIGIFVGTARGYREDQKTATVSDELAMAMAQVTEDVEMAGFWGYALDPTDVRPDSIGGRQYWVALAPSGTATLTFSGTHCGPQPPLSAAQIAGGQANNNVWTYDANLWSWRPVYSESNLTSATATNFPCITDAQTGTDVIALFRVNGGWTHKREGGVDSYAGGATSLTPNRVYLRANNKIGSLWKYTATTPAPPAEFFSPTDDYWDWEYRISIYYIRNYSISAGDGIPSLCRKFLSYAGTTPAMQTECYSQGIENLQVEYGIDEDAAVPDGVPDRYVSNPTTAQLSRVTSLRIWMLARSTNLDTSAGAADTLQGRTAHYSNDKTYIMAGGDAAGGKTVTPADNLFRRLSTSTVLIRNPANLRKIGS